MGNDKNLSKDVLNAVNKKTGKAISESEVKKIASGVTANTLQSEAELTKLIKQVSSMAKVPVSDKTINDIVKAVKASGMNMNNIETIMKMMIKK
ncbi:stage VI sporulation protein F [Paenibacillus cellulosilyticus]|uniref:Stage VI sporulation protein F n=1 Tax=Paenibacillus cellulosilyticus TaxID=375489 RepID=A0A2V2YYQ1_9BACL|nr:stage VI sporulation protein F [Paenibacillus cellulosilyticus]PWW05564.1 stage VI sporulation protein F [Paenibacillus cellulosilyticus]QKS45400.1 stage VI sporulation protein F [Paenibacillus cellulosilyticus]